MFCSLFHEVRAHLREEIANHHRYLLPDAPVARNVDLSPEESGPDTPFLLGGPKHQKKHKAAKNRSFALR
jgi:hypothetical protein